MATTSGDAKAHTADFPWWEEYVYIVPVDLNLIDKIGTVYDGPDNAPQQIAKRCYKSSNTINLYMEEIYKSIKLSGKVVEATLDQDVKSFNKNMYKGKPKEVGYKMYFNAAACDDKQLKNTFESLKTTRGAESKFKDSSAQLDYEKFQNSLYLSDSSIYSTVVKIMYMLTYGLEAKAKYEDATVGKGTNHYKELLGKSVRFLWGEYEETQWHRGVDFYVGEHKEQ